MSSKSPTEYSNPFQYWRNRFYPDRTNPPERLFDNLQLKNLLEMEDGAKEIGDPRIRKHFLELVCSLITDKIRDCLTSTDLKFPN